MREFVKQSSLQWKTRVLKGWTDLVSRALAKLSSGGD
jgi:hypothetical protein